MNDNPRPATPDPSKTRRGGRPSRRGGRRPGAGAPKGNMNALKSGRYSKQMKALRLALQAMPATSDVVRRFDAAGTEKRTMLARALQHYAELLIAEPLVISNIIDLLKQSTKTPQSDLTQTQPARENAKTNGQSRESIDA